MPSLLGFNYCQAQDCSKYDDRINEANKEWVNKNYTEMERLYYDVLKEFENEESCIPKQIYVRLNLARYYSNFHLKYDSLKQYLEIISLSNHLNNTDERRLIITEEFLQFLLKNKAFEESLPLVKLLHRNYELDNDLTSLLSVKLLLLNIYMELDDWDSFEIELEIVESKLFEEVLLSKEEVLKEYYEMHLRFAMSANNKEKAYKLINLLKSKDKEHIDASIASNIRMITAYHYFNDWSESLTERLIETTQWSKTKIINDFKSFDSIGSQEDYISFLETRYHLFNSVVFQYKINNQQLLDDISFIKQFILRYRLHQLDSNSYLTETSIEKNLAKDETYIEYSSFYYHNGLYLTDEVLYHALIYKNEWDTPKMIKLFKESKIRPFFNIKVEKDTIRERGGKASLTSNRKNIYNLIFKPLEPFIKEKETLLILPSGLLNQVSFGALKKDSIFLHNKYNIKRISHLSQKSTKKNEIIHSAVLFGDINFGNRVNNQECNNWSYLPGTKVEIDSLNKILKREGIKTNIFSKKMATESAFKKLSGKSPDIIHVATHGFFLENGNKSDKINLEDNVLDLRLFDNPLVKSGLVLHNGNDACKDNSSDGILTSLEISRLDLSGTKLVVLSACDTGLGDVIGHEGVYGLQRAFLMAGVDSILMSLWKVDDEGTAIFMKILYENFIKTNDIALALDITRKRMQSLFKIKTGFQDQRLYSSDVWAAFVLLEG